MLFQFLNDDYFARRIQLQIGESPSNLLFPFRHDLDLLRLGDAIDRRHERLPGAALRGEHLLSLGGQSVITSPALTGLLHPPALNPASLLQPVKQWVKRSDVELHGAVRASFDKLADFIAMARPSLDQSQDQQLRTPLL